MPHSLATEGVLQRFLDRIGRDLALHPLDLDPSSHRQQFAGALDRCGGGTYYDLLEISTDADETEIHAAYQALARLVHPVHAERIGLAGRQGVADVLFERATEAYLVLSDPHRRSTYDREAAVLSRRPAGQRKAEASRLADDLLARAQSLVDRDDYHYALELLQQAVRANPDSAPCWALMGRCRAQNPKWLHMASDNLRRAVELDPSAVEHRLALAAVEEQRERWQEAARLYRQVLERSAEHAAAQEGLARIEAGVEESPKKRWWGS